jgi:hypothetical protein
MTHDDPGREWTETLLAPLRHVHIERFDVAPAVMARLAAGRHATRPLPEPAAVGWRQGLAWIASFATGVLALGLLAMTIFALASGGEARTQGVALLQSCGRMGNTLAGIIAGLAAAFGAAAAPILRGAWAVLQAAAPLVRGAGMATALLGAFSIVISIYIFAGARRTSPVTTLKGDLE